MCGCVRACVRVYMRGWVYIYNLYIYINWHWAKRIELSLYRLRACIPTALQCYCVYVGFLYVIYHHSDQFYLIILLLLS